MNYNSGIFICPKCGYNGMNGYKKWLSRNEYDKIQLTEKYIFYNELSGCKWICCIGCCCIEKSIKDEFGNIISCGCYGKCNHNRNPVVYCFYPCCFLFYILFFIWIDIINFLCCFKRIYNKIRGIKEANNIDASRIWIDVEGFSKEFYNSQFISQCDNCKYITRNFDEFIPPSTVTISNRNDLSERKELKINDIFAVNFDYIDFHFCTTCRKTDKFNQIEKKLYEEYPELESNNIYFLANGQIIDRNKTIEENNIKAGNTILIKDNEFY